MRMTLIAVVRAKPGPHRDLFEHYAERLGHGLLGGLRLKEVEERRPLPPVELKSEKKNIHPNAILRTSRRASVFSFAIVEAISRQWSMWNA